MFADVDTITGAGGLVGGGISIGIMSWLLLKHLPAQDVAQERSDKAVAEAQLAREKVWEAERLRWEAERKMDKEEREKLEAARKFGSERVERLMAASQSHVEKVVATFSETMQRHDEVFSKEIAIERAECHKYHEENVHRIASVEAGLKELERSLERFCRPMETPPKKRSGA